MQSELRRRSFPKELAPFIRTHPAREWIRLAADKLRWRRLTQDEHAPFSVDAIYTEMDGRVAERVKSGLTIKAVYAYDSGALSTFRMAGQRGVTCVYEHPTIYWRLVQQLQPPLAIH